MRRFFTILTGLCLFFYSSYLHAADIKWILLGAVVQKESFQPIENVNVCLEIKNSKTNKTCYTTLENGHFQFLLEGDKVYSIHLIDAQNNIVKSKEISTLGKEAPEIMHLLFEY